MGFVLVKIRILPSSPDVDFKIIENSIRTLIEKEDKKTGLKFEKEPIAFGLNALIITYSWPEEKELEKLENSIRDIENINSSEVIDMRRALG